MIDLYTVPTPNGHRAAMALEECALPYRVHKVNLQKGEQQSAEYRAINPAAMVPVIVDPSGPGGKPMTLSQSGAIAIYLAEKSGRLIPADSEKRYEAFQWFMQASTDCAICSQAIAQLVNHAPVKSPSSVQFFEERMIRMFGDADRRLQSAQYLAGDEYSIAEVALYPIVHVRRAYVERAQLTSLLRWMETLSKRPAVQRGMQASL